MCFFIWLFSIKTIIKESQIPYVLLCFVTHGFKSYCRSDDRLGASDREKPYRLQPAKYPGHLYFYRAWQAKKRIGNQDKVQASNDMGFTLISLFDGFVIVAAIDLGFPSWLTGLIGIIGIIAGINAIAYKRSRFINKP
jgi:hypothetical protein